MVLGIPISQTGIAMLTLIVNKLGYRMKMIMLVISCRMHSS